MTIFLGTENFCLFMNIFKISNVAKNESWHDVLFFLILLFFLLKYPSWLYLFCRVRLFYFYIIIIIIISCPRRFVNQASTYLPLPDPSSGHTNVDFFPVTAAIQKYIYWVCRWLGRCVQCSLIYFLHFFDSYPRFVFVRVSIIWIKP